MATFINFSSLQANIRNALQRGASLSADPIVFTQIPYFINAAERKLATILKIQGMLTPIVDLVGFQEGNPVVTKPDRWRQTVSINFGVGGGSNRRTPVFPRSYEYCREFWPDDTLTGVPKFYADYDLQHWLIVPTPDQDYPVEIMAYLLPPLLDEANQTNFWSDYTPNALFYGSMLEAVPFLGKDDRIPTWQGMWQFELQSLNGQDLQKILDRSAERERA